MPSTKKAPSAVISWPGYGILFFWQLGILQYLEGYYQLSDCIMIGSSAGALLSVLAACKVNPQKALDRAHELCIEYGVYKRPLGLIGVWGKMVQQWLDELLPADAAGLCSNGRVRIVVTTLPLLQRKVIDHFKDRNDLVNVALASAHVPFVLNWRLAARCRGQLCVDGSLLYILTRRCHALKPSGLSCPTLLLDPFTDRQLLSGWNLLQCIALCGKQAAQQLLEQGHACAARMDAAGEFSALQQLQLTTDKNVHMQEAATAAQEAIAVKQLASSTSAVYLVATCHAEADTSPEGSSVLPVEPGKPQLQSSAGTVLEPKCVARQLRDA